jgi:leucyl/phenylalanyl-tRNA---protein transferase
VPLEPPPTSWELTPAAVDHPHDLWLVGADLEPGTVLKGYRLGLFPMRLPDPTDGTSPALGWWSPEVRAVFPLDIRPPRTLRRARGSYEVRINSSFRDVMLGCADPSRPHGWIDASFIEGYVTLHRLGWAHSVECWDDDGLAGGVYGVAIGGLFAAESMFQRRPDAAKRALLGLIEVLREAGAPARRVLDAQWHSPHLGLLGAREITRAEYHDRLAIALEVELPSQFLPSMS